MLSAESVVLPPIRVYGSPIPANDAWIAEIPQTPGAMVYGQTREQAVSRVEALALRVLAERTDVTR